MKQKNTFALNDFREKIEEIDSIVSLKQVEKELKLREQRVRSLNESAKLQTAKYIVQTQIRRLRGDYGS